MVQRADLDLKTIWRGGSLLANVSPAGTKHYTLDHLGSPRVVTDRLGVSFIPSFESFRSGGGTGTLQFTGHERERGQGTLDYMHARYYSPGLGRFLSIDRKMRIDRLSKRPQDWNRYTYVSNNPIAFVDLDGLEKTIYIYQLFSKSEIRDFSRLKATVEARTDYHVQIVNQPSRTVLYTSLRSLDRTDVAILVGHGGAISSPAPSFAQALTQFKGSETVGNGVLPAPRLAGRSQALSPPEP